MRIADKVKAPPKLYKKGSPMYYYEHTNGEIISKPDFVVETGTTPEEYFNSPFVVRWWKE